MYTFLPLQNTALAVLIPNNHQSVVCLFVHLHICLWYLTKYCKRFSRFCWWNTKCCGMTSSDLVRCHDSDEFVKIWVGFVSRINTWNGFWKLGYCRSLFLRHCSQHVPVRWSCFDRENYRSWFSGISSSSFLLRDCSYWSSLWIATEDGNDIHIQFILLHTFK